ncbi:MAG: hemin uptake protein HemP [Rubrivivax sp.]|jgi:hemin uptake protein HemP|nr:hemin uptake protein HemP [Rubrivivax sp.]
MKPPAIPSPPPQVEPRLPVAPVAPPEPQRLRRIASRDLFAGGREVEIEHQSQVYRLRCTSLGKLILTK